MDLMPLGQTSTNWLHSLSRGDAFMQAASRCAKTTAMTMTYYDLAPTKSGKGGKGMFCE